MLYDLNIKFGYFWDTLCIEELIAKLKRLYAPAKRELGNTYMWEKENVLSYAATIKKNSDRIEDAHRLNNNGQVLDL